MRLQESSTIVNVDKTKYKTCTPRHVVDQRKIVTLLQQLPEVRSTAC